MIDARQLFDYAPLTGLLTWRVRPSNRVHIGDVIRSKDKDGYIQVMFKGRNYKAHRIIWFWMKGKWPKNDIDHKDVCPSNNKWDNLREATDRQNRWNTPARKNNKCGLKGVCHHHSGKWAAYIGVKGKTVYLGTYDTKERAHAAYADAAKRYFGEFARAA